MGAGLTPQELLGWWPVVPKDDPIVLAMAYMPTPTMEEALAHVKKGDLARLCQVVAIHFAAWGHVHTREGEKFAGPTHQQGAMYDPLISLWWDGSKCADGGAMKITQSGYGPNLYGTRFLTKAPNEDGVMQVVRPATPAPGGPAVPRTVCFTNDGYKDGYRLVVNGERLAEIYREIVWGFKSSAFRKILLDRLDDALAEARAKTAGVGRLLVPAHQRLLVRVSIGRKADGSSYIDFGFGLANLERVRKHLFAGLPPGARGVSIRMEQDPDRPGSKRAGVIVLRGAGHSGWAFTAGSSVQCSTLASANVAEPNCGPQSVCRVLSVPVDFHPDGSLRLYLPPSVVTRKERGGDGLPGGHSQGSVPGRAKTVGGNLEIVKVDADGKTLRPR